MPAKQFILNYSGGKYKESKELDDLKIDYEKYDTVIEPFGGTFGFSRYLFYDLKQTHLNFIVCDSNYELIDFYNYLKDLIIKNEHEAFFKRYTTEIKKLYENCKYEKNTAYLDRKKLLQYLKTNKTDNTFLNFLICHNHLNNVSSTTPAAYKNNVGFTEIFKQTTFLKKKFEELPEEMLYNKKNLVYLDPPYLSSDNATYDTLFNFNTIFEKIENIFKNGNVLFIHQYNFLLNRVLNFAQSITYKKRYNRSKKKVEHTCFYNFINE